MGRTLEPEDRISHYRIVGPLGAGGMGEVYIAQDETLDRSVALKILPPQLVRNEERVRRFVTEAKSASSLNHPNIVTIYEIGRDVVKGAVAEASEPVHFISMELVTGDTLEQKIHHDRCDVKLLLGWLGQAAEGVAKAHAAGIVHRDLKPGNVMVSRDGFAKVLDFGLAKLVEKQAMPGDARSAAPTATSARTDEGTVLGTVGYMSPEQVQGKAVDHRSDIFSMGCMLYEAVTGRRPFIGDTDVDVLHQILHDRPTPIEELNPKVPTEARRLIRRCLAKSPDQRLQSMKDLAIEIREIVDEYESLSASASSGGTSASGVLGVPPVRRTTPRLWIVVASLLGFGALVVGLYNLIGGGRSAAPPSEQMTLNVLMSRNDLDEGVLSDDGRYLAYITAADGKTALDVRQVRTGSDARILPPQETVIRGLRFSPDGDYVYYLGLDPRSPNYHALFQVASLGGTPRKVAFDVDSAVTFSPDGKRVCFRRGYPDAAGDALVILDLASGEERELIRVSGTEGFNGPDRSTALAWSPDGARVAVGIFDSKDGARTRIATIDVASGERTPVGSESWLLVDSLDWLPDGKGMMLSAFVIGVRGFQIYRLSYPAGEVRRLTSDLDGYTGLSLSADGKSVATIRDSGVNNVWVASLDPGGEARPITFDTGATSVELIVPLADGGVAFTAPQNNNVYLWRMEADGSARRQLTSKGVYILDMEYAERAGIVFTQAEENAALHVWRVEPDGSGLKQLTNGPGERLQALSPAGTWLLSDQSDQQQATLLLNLNGGEPIVVEPGRRAGAGLFSPDGQRLLLTRLEPIEGRLYPNRVVIPAGGGEPLTTFLLPPGIFDLHWAPDGQAVTYIDQATGFNLMRQSIEGGEAERLTSFDAGRLVHHRWSPDGTRIALQRRLGQQESLSILQPGKTAPTAVTEFKTGEIRALHWARDSRSLVFTYGTSSQDVVLMSGI